MSHCYRRFLKCNALAIAGWWDQCELHWNERRGYAIVLPKDTRRMWLGNSAYDRYRPLKHTYAYLLFRSVERYCSLRLVGPTPLLPSIPGCYISARIGVVHRTFTRNICLRQEIRGQSLSETYVERK
jgi:hypothetical protein